MGSSSQGTATGPGRGRCWRPPLWSELPGRRYRRMGRDNGGFMAVRWWLLHGGTVAVQSEAGRERAGVAGKEA